jgi:hypothetical protein
VTPSFKSGMFFEIDRGPSSVPDIIPEVDGACIMCAPSEAEAGEFVRLPNSQIGEWSTT